MELAENRVVGSFTRNCDRIPVLSDCAGSDGARLLALCGARTSSRAGPVIWIAACVVASALDLRVYFLTDMLLWKACEKLFSGEPHGEDSQCRVYKQVALEFGGRVLH